MYGPSIVAGQNIYLLNFIFFGILFTKKSFVLLRKILRNSISFNNIQYLLRSYSSKYPCLESEQQLVAFYIKQINHSASKITPIRISNFHLSLEHKLSLFPLSLLLTSTPNISIHAFEDRLQVSFSVPSFKSSLIKTSSRGG